MDIIRVARLSSVFDTFQRTFPLDTIVTEIRRGIGTVSNLHESASVRTLAEHTAYARELLTRGQREGYELVKGSLPQFFPAVDANGRGADSIKSFSGLVCIEWDLPKTDTASAFASFAENSHIVLAWRSLSRKPKVLVRVKDVSSDGFRLSAKTFAHAWLSAALCFEDIGDADPAASRPLQSQNICYDPDLIFRPDADALSWSVDAEALEDAMGSDFVGSVARGVFDDLGDLYQERILKMSFDDRGVGSEYLPCPFHEHEHDGWDSRQNKTRVIRHADEDITLRCYKCGSAKRFSGDGYRESDVIIAGQLGDVINDAFQKLAKTNSPLSLFQMAGGLWGRLLTGEDTLTEVRGDAFRALLSENLRFFKFKKDALVAASVSRDIAVGVESHRDRRVKFPVVEQVLNHPVLTPDGTLNHKRGYLPSLKSLLVRDYHLQLCDSVDAAREKLMHPFRHFIFATDKDRANAFAYLFSLLLRNFFGRVPIFAFLAAKYGTGKGLLVSSLYQIVAGAPLPTATYKRRDEDMERQIVSVLMRGSAGALVDNIPDGWTVESPILEALATAELFSGKVLYRTQFVDFRTRAVWALTGNNLQFSGGTSRRVQTVTLQSDVQDPYLRKLPELDIGRHREELLSAALTIAVKWHEKGLPEADIHLGSFQRWARVIGGVLTFSGITGFDPVNIACSDDDLALQDFMFSVYDYFQQKSFSAADVVEAGIDLEGVVDASEDKPAIRLGYLFKKVDGQIWTDNSGVSLRLSRVAESKRPAKYVFHAPSLSPFDDEIPF